MVKLHWTPQAVDDLEAIFKHISHDSRSVARLFVEKIYYRVDQLRHFPLSGRIVPEVEDRIPVPVICWPLCVVRGVWVHVQPTTDHLPHTLPVQHHRIRKHPPKTERDPCGRVPSAQPLNAF